ncbi:protein FAR1-RELATED SEQUENCE 5-like isoform X3 [Chenopodium quinoa]|nr:protein FAR1-RELATED SEQUENCE 5-like isoform X3 [Chenopodium quinoa]
MPTDMYQLSSQKFSNREILLETVRGMAYSLGFVTVIQKSKKKKNRWVIIGCDHGGSYRTNRSRIPNSGKKKSGTRLMNCPFQICGRMNQGTSWRVEIKYLSHNHNLSSDISGHPYTRRFSREEVNEIKEMIAADIAPRQILTKLRKGNSNLKAISRTLYNVKAKIIKDGLGGRSMIQALMDELGKGGFTYDVECDNEGHVTHLLFSHPSSIELARIYSYTFVMDCTYKINKYKMPLLDIVGVTSFNTSFFCGFAFLFKEEESDYVWALQKFGKILGYDKQPSVIVTDRELALMNAIKVVFPNTCNLLCVWHIEKNILAKCKPFFDDGDEWDVFMSDWTNLIDSSTEDQFNEAWSEIEVKYGKYRDILIYIHNTWFPWKKYFFRAWSSEYMHFGHVSSRAEGSHATLKKYLEVSSGDLRTVKEKICHAVDHQYNEIKTQLSSEKIRIPHDLRIPFLSKLIGHVSHFALRKLLNQFELAYSDSLSPTCIGQFSKTMGLPCAHVMRRMTNEDLKLDTIHYQWRMDNISLSKNGENQDVHGDRIDVLVQELQLKYQQLPLTQKEGIRKQISQFVSPSSPLVLEPMIRQSKTLGTNSRKKKKQSSSTKKDPSGFEMVEKVRRCNMCGNMNHDRRRCPKNTTQNSSMSFMPPILNGLPSPSTSFVVDLNLLPPNSDYNNPS